MAEHRVVLDAFAEARRTWDDLVALQPDVLAGSGRLQENDLNELQTRVDAHREAIDDLADALETEPAGRGENAPGISNRESAPQEEVERREHPPLDVEPLPPDSPPPAHPVDGAFGSGQRGR